MTQNSIFKTKRLFSHYFYAVAAILFILINGNLSAQVQEQLSYRMYEAGHNLPYDSASPPVGIDVPTIIGDQSDNLNKIPVKKPNSKSGAKISSVNAFVPETVACNLSTYQSATIIGPGDFPYTSGSGIIVNASTNVATLNNTTYSCGGNSFSTAPTAWWIQFTNEVITLTFSVPVTNFSMVMNGSNNTEVFTFTPTTGTVSLSEYCTSAFEVIGAGNQLQCNASGTYGTIVTINNPTGSTVYTITHNGLLAGSRISLLDCYVGGPVPVVDPVSNVQACGGDMVSAIAFTGTSGATFNWTNNNTAIGLAASGSGNIASFTASNVSSQQVATITVTPVLGAESGTPVTFTITVKPKPTLTLGTFMGPVTCGGSNGSIAFTTTNLPNGIYSLTYTGPGSPQNVIVSGNAFLLSGRTAGSYSNFSITINGCTGTVAGPVNLSDPSYTWYRDLDGDTFGNPSVTQTSCTPPVGYVANSTDCDDNDPLEKPGQVWYDDTDNDGYGQTGAASITQCLRPTGYRAAVELLATSGDCNDNNAAIKPGATEVCDGVDNDCDGSTDEGVLTTYYRDFDADTFGNPAMTQQACSQPIGYVTNNTDCDDNDLLEKPGQVWYDDSDNDGYGQTGAASITQCLRPTGYRAAVELLATSGDCNDNNAAIKPGATEVCDGVDNDCDGSTDEGVLTTYYRDFDGDTFGNPAMTQQACSQPIGYVASNTDCNDNDPLEKPGQVWYDDTDNDGYGQTGAASITQCLRPTGYRAASELLATSGDCNDNNNTINPAAAEVCDGIDNDCDGNLDNGTLITYYRDFDGDTFGDPATTIMACTLPVGYVTNNTDCDDIDPLEKPGQVWYKDTDNDSYGQTGASTITQCLRPAGYKVVTELLASSGDCNDNNGAIYPGATEVCDGIDNNCDGTTDEGLTTRYYFDFDGDGYGEAVSFIDACAPSGLYTTTIVGDCIADDADINPGATEICDGKDNNCDGQTDEGLTTRYYFDFDGDGYGEAVSFIDACAPDGFYTATMVGDCVADDADINPGATEICDGKDNDCDGQTDEGLTTRYYFDFDADGYGEELSFIDACAPDGFYTATLVGDCVADDADINPGASEICDGIDNDCDGSIDEGVLTTYYADVDQDGFGNPSSSTQACTQPGGYVTNNTDCDDNDPLEKPGQIW
ncbi:MAG: putative metal-binding motif-containing protein, partial [Saprospiraceae bacterium]